MSAIIAIKRSERVELFTDGAMWDAQGCFAGSASKVFRFPNLYCAISGRGAATALPRFADTIGKATFLKSYDDLCLHAAELANVLFGREPAVAESLELVIAGISETRGPSIDVVAGGERSGLTPWTLYSVNPGAHLCMPWSDQLAEICERELPMASWADDDAAGLKVMQFIRDLPLEHRGALMVPCGGFVEKTIVARSGSTTECIHDWNDVAGRPIDSHEGGKSEPLFAFASVGTANIQNLAVGTLEIAGAAVTVPLSGTNPGPIPGPVNPSQAVLIENMSIQGVAGSQITIVALARYNLGDNGINGYQMDLFINNIDVNSVASSLETPQQVLVGTYTFTASGGVDIIPIQCNWFTASSAITLESLVLYASAAKR